MDRETLIALADFKDELEERLCRIRPLVAGLPDDAMARDPEAVHGLFREFHSLKSAANLLGLRPIGRLTHKLEDFLEDVRSQVFPVDQAVRDLLSAVVERLAYIGSDLRKVRLLDVSRDLEKIEAALRQMRR